MDLLHENLRVRFAEPLLDGRNIRLRRWISGGRDQLVVQASGDCGTEILATIVHSSGEFIVSVPGEEAVPMSREAVLELVEELARPYSNKCWKCHKPLTLTAENRCPKCRRFVLCECGVCLCDNPSLEQPIRPAPRREPVSAEVAEELNRRYGHLFRRKSQ
jgi:hypothetical protein